MYACVCKILDKRERERDTHTLDILWQNIGHVGVPKLTLGAAKKGRRQELQYMPRGVIASKWNRVTIRQVEEEPEGKECNHICDISNGALSL
jgi:hypothetical protein